MKLPIGRSRSASSEPAARAKKAASDPLEGIPLFALVAPELRARIKKRLALRQVSDDKPLFSMGEPSNALYVVASGRFRVSVRDRFKDERVLQFVGPGEVLGEAAFMADSPHVTTAVATEPSRAWGLARADFDELLGREQPVMRYLASVISQRQAQANTRIAHESAPDEERTERGYVTAFFSPRGGAGCTTAAVAVAVSLAEEHPDQVVLLDLSVLFGHTASYLWLQPKGTLSQVPPNTLVQLDRRGLDYYLLSHESSLRVFPGAARPEDGEQITAEHVRAAVGVLRRWFTHVVLDLPHNFSEVALTGLELAQRIYALSTPEITSLRDIVEVKRIATDLLAIPEEKLRWVLNHPLPYAGVPMSDFAAVTGVPWEEIPHGGDAPSLAALRGEALVNTKPGNPLSKMAQRIGGEVNREAQEMLALAGGA